MGQRVTRRSRPMFFRQKKTLHKAGTALANDGGWLSYSEQ
jgi:hypothetical protein